MTVSLSTCKTRSGNLIIGGREMRIDMPSEKEAAVLRLLISNPEMFGLEMVNACVGLKRGTIYVTLGRMEDEGWVKSRTQKDRNSSGLPRRLYSITGLGQRALAAREAAENALGGLADLARALS